MPADLISLEGIWEKALETGKELKIKVSRTGLFATLDELDEIIGDVEWLWQGWIPKGFVTMLAGDPGIGKSAMAQYFVKIITDGSCFPLEESQQPRKPKDAIWVDTEASQQILKMRARSMKINKKRVYIPVINGDILSQANLGNDSDRQQIIELIEGTDSAILVVDSLGGSHSRGENKVEDVRPVLEFLALVARDHQIAVLLIHHLNKGKEGESTEVSLYRIRGSTVIPAYCRSIMALEQSAEKKLRLRLIKSNLARMAEPILVIPILDEEEEFTGFDCGLYVPPPPKKTRKESCADWVMGILEKQKDKSIHLSELIQAGQEAGFTRGNIYAARDVLGDRIMFGGTGKDATWSVTTVDKITVKRILSNGKANRVGKKK